MNPVPQDTLVDLYLPVLIGRIDHRMRAVLAYSLKDMA
jgi:hypothetical protein